MKKRKFGTRLFAGILSAVLIAGLMPASSLADVQGGVETEATYDFYVDAKNGNDANSGTSEETAFETVEKAAKTAKSGDTIKLGDGKYTLYEVDSTDTTKGKDLTFVGNGATKTGWNIGAKVPNPDNYGTEYNGDYSFDGAGTVTFKDMTLQSAEQDYLGFIRAGHTVVKDCTINGRTAYWGYETATFKNTTFACTNGYAIWTYSSPKMTFDHCTFDVKDRAINVYTDYDAGKHNITVNFSDCTVNATDKSKAALSINDSNMGDYKYIINFSGKNTVNGLETSNTTCSKLFAFGDTSGNRAKNDFQNRNTGRSVISIDGKTVWEEGKMVSHEIDTENDKYTDGYKDDAYDYSYSDWEMQNNGSYTRDVTKTCQYCGHEETETETMWPTPDEDDIRVQIGDVTLIHTGSNANHEDASYGLIPGSYEVRTASNASPSNATVAYVTVHARDYLNSYNEDNGTHKVLGTDYVKRTLVYDAEDKEWVLAEGQNPVTFLIKCEDEKKDDDKKDDDKKDDDKKDDDKKDDEKQYTDIKFVVVNGSFTENGQTEITKSFEVGTALTLADIPASKGKSSRYSDQTWDKYPLGYVIGKDGTTFTITYLYQSSSDGDSDSGNGGGSTTTRGRATNANGKSGHWILEGGEFTEDNGRLPCNEYLKIGDTIYGFYTYGFAIDFDRPEYYTDAAIQAKGGYRDASGTWRLNGWWFLYDDGTFPHNEWVYLSWNGRSDWYYFDVDGWMEDNWFYWNNNWYYLHTKYDNTRGHMYTGWHEINGKWYYFNTASDKGTLGAMLADTTTPDGYRVDANGAWIQ